MVMVGDSDAYGCWHDIFNEVFQLFSFSVVGADWRGCMPCSDGAGGKGRKRNLLLHLYMALAAYVIVTSSFIERATK